MTALLLLVSSRITSVGHTFTQVPQPMHPLIASILIFSVPQVMSFYCRCPSGTATSCPLMVWHVPVTELPPLPEKLTLSPSCLSLHALIASGGGPCFLSPRLSELLFAQPASAIIATSNIGKILFVIFLFFITFHLLFIS